MRDEKEIKGFIDDLEFVLSIPGACPGEEILKTHAILLRWCLGEDNEAGVARAKLMEEIDEALPNFSPATRARAPKRGGLF